MSEVKPEDVKAEEAPEADAKDSEAKVTESKATEETVNGEDAKKALKEEDEETKEEVTTEKVNETKEDEKVETSTDDEKTEEKDETAIPKKEESTKEKEAEDKEEATKEKEVEVKDEDKKVEDEEMATDDKEEVKEAKDDKENGSKEEVKEEEVKEEEVKEEEMKEEEMKEEEVKEEEAKEEAESPAKTAKPSPAKTPRSGKRTKKTSLDTLFDDSIQIPAALKRERKQVGVYAPENFKEEITPHKKVVAKVGRGQKLRDLLSVKDSIARTAAKDPILAAAHKLIFGGGRGRSSVSKKHIKSRLLDFNGYLEVMPEDTEKATVEKLDQDAESKMATRAYKMTVPLLKTLCDLFDVDRIPAEGKAVIDKDTLIDRLLDFLGAPDSKYLKTPKKVSVKKRKAPTPTKSKSPTPKKKKVRKEIGKKAKAQERTYQEDSETENEMDVDSEEESEEEVVNMPTDKLLRKWVRAYVNCFNLDKATTKHAIETASDRFGVDLTGKKARIKELLTEEMS